MEENTLEGKDIKKTEKFIVCIKYVGEKIKERGGNIERIDTR